MSADGKSSKRFVLKSLGTSHLGTPGVGTPIWVLPSGYPLLGTPHHGTPAYAKALVFNSNLTSESELLQRLYDGNT